VVGCRECRAPEIRVKAMEGAEELKVQAPKDSPAYGARNVQTVAAGTGEALPGRAKLFGGGGRLAALSWESVSAGGAAHCGLEEAEGGRPRYG
jgi:hypothetical protein